MNRRFCLALTFFILSTIHYSFLLALPKNKLTGGSATTQPVEKSAPTFHYLGPRRADQVGVPYVDVRVGIPETPGGANHMRRQVALSSTGTVHMVYGIYNASGGSNWSDVTPADSDINSLYFYNAYDCGGSNALRNGSLDVQMKQIFANIGDDRPRVMRGGGLFIPPGAGYPVIYGNRLIQRTDLGNGRFTLTGCATIKDGAECLGNFSMDTTMFPTRFPTRTSPVAYPLNESTWVATYRGSNAEEVWFNYTTDRGITWTTPNLLGTYSPWFNSTEIAANGNTFYVVSVTNPNDPTAFKTTERPCYLKGNYDPATGAITFGTITDITGDFELPRYLANMLDISALMAGDTLHVLWTDWNNWMGTNGFPGPGGHVHHAAVLPDGTVQGPHKITNIKIDGRLPTRSGPSCDLCFVGPEPWPMASLSYDPSKNLLFALWSAPPDDGNFGWGDYAFYNQSPIFACYDIFMAASPNNGRSWSVAQNVTQTNNPGCDGSPENPCHHEDQFEVAAIANDTVWIGAMVQRYPGLQESKLNVVAPDLGPYTEHYDIFRLYKAPAPVPPFACLIRGDVNNDSALTPSDVVELLKCVFLAIFPECSCDLNCDGFGTPADVALGLNAVFVETPLVCR